MKGCLMPGSIGYKMVSGCKIHKSEANEWWNLYKGMVPKGLAEARNIASVGAKTVNGPS